MSRPISYRTTKSLRYVSKAFRCSDRVPLGYVCGVHRHADLLEADTGIDPLNRFVGGAQKDTFTTTIEGVSDEGCSKRARDPAPSKCRKRPDTRYLRCIPDG